MQQAPWVQAFTGLSALVSLIIGLIAVGTSAAISFAARRAQIDTSRAYQVRAADQWETVYKAEHARNQQLAQDLADARSEIKDRMREFEIIKTEHRTAMHGWEIERAVLVKALADKDEVITILKRDGHA